MSRWEIPTSRQLEDRMSQALHHLESQGVATSSKLYQGKETFFKQLIKWRRLSTFSGIAMTVAPGTGTRCPSRTRSAGCRSPSPQPSWTLRSARPSTVALASIPANASGAATGTIVEALLLGIPHVIALTIDPAFTALLFQIRLLGLTGFRPQTDHCAACGMTRGDCAALRSARSAAVCGFQRGRSARGCGSVRCGAITRVTRPPCPNV